MNKFTLKKNWKQSFKALVVIAVAVLPLTLKAQTPLYWNAASGDWEGANAWSSASGGTGDVTWDVATDYEAVFEYAGLVSINPATTANMICSKVTVTSACTGVTILKPANYKTFASNTIFDVATGKYFKTGATMNLAPTSNTLTYTKTGGGEFYIVSGKSAQTFNLNGGILTLNAITGELTTLNIADGTTIATLKTTASAQQEHTYALNVNGNFSLGVSSLTPSGNGKLDGFLGFMGAVNLGDGTNRTITNVGMKSATFSGIVSGVGSSLTLASTYINSVSTVDDGAITLSGANTYSGGTTITSGKVYAANASALGTGMLTMAGGNLSVMTGGKNIATTGVSVNVSGLKLTDNSTIALGTGAHTLSIGNSSAEAWTSGKTLTITGWTGTAGTSGTGTEGQIMVGSGGLTPAQLAQITFDGAPYTGAIITASGELVPTDVSTGNIKTLTDKNLFIVNTKGIVSTVDGDVQVMNLSGMTLKSQKVTIGQQLNLQKGVYLIRMLTSEGISTQKVVL